MKVVVRLIRVTFGEHFPLELVDSFCDTHFLNLGQVYRRENPRELYVRPIVQTLPLLRQQLDVWKQEGMLSYVEEAEQS